MKVLLGLRRTPLAGPQLMIVATLARQDSKVQSVDAAIPQTEMMVIWVLTIPVPPSEQVDDLAHDQTPSHLDVLLKSPSDHAGCLPRKPLERDSSIWNHQCPALQ